MKSMSVRAAPRRLASASSLPGNLHGDRHEVLGAIELEVVHLHRDRDVGDRVLQHQRFFELPLLVGVGEAAERLVGEVALPIRQLAGLAAVQRDADAPELAVGVGVRAVVADDVVAR